MYNPVSRDKVVSRSLWISTIGNLLLSVAKIVVGFVSGSLAVISDGIDSATDVIISIVMVFTACIMHKPPDQKYVYGYEKAEVIATKVLSMIIFYAGMQMFISSVQTMFSDEPRTIPSVIAIYVTVFSMAGKLLLALYQYRQGKKINSSLLTANAVNMRNDVLISLGVLVGLLFTFVFKLPVLDAVTSMIISLFIIKSAISIFMESNIELMDGVKDESVYDKIFEAVAEIPEVSNPHRVRSRMIGNMYMISLDVEVNGDITLNEAHEIANRVEDSIKQKVVNVYDVVVHVEPLGKCHPKEQFGIDRHNVTT